MTPGTWIALAGTVATFLAQIVILAVWGGGMRTKMAELERRIGQAEKDISGIPEIRQSLAVLRERFDAKLEGLTGLIERDGREFRADLSQMKHSLDQMIERLPQRAGRAPRRSEA